MAELPTVYVNANLLRSAPVRSPIASVWPVVHDDHVVELWTDVGKVPSPRPVVAFVGVRDNTHLADWLRALADVIESHGVDE